MILETESLLKRWQDGDKEARNQLVEENMGLVRSITKRFQGRGHEMEDLLQIGTIGLMKAIDHFDLSYHVCFSTYAVPMICGEIRRFLRDDGLIKISRLRKENFWKLQKAAVAFCAREGREASISELARETDLTEEEITLAMEADVEITSIYQSVYQGEGNEIYLVDQLAQNKPPSQPVYDTLPLKELDEEKEELLNRMLLQQLLDSLDEQERMLIKLRYFMDKTQVEVAKIMNMTQVKVSRMEKRILCKMREQVFSDKKE